MNIDQWIDQAKAKGESETLIHVVSTLTNEHAPVHPTYKVPVNEEAHQTWMEAVKSHNMPDFDPWARPDLWKEEQAEFVDCNTCPDTAGWPCPVRLTIARCLGVDPE